MPSRAGRRCSRPRALPHLAALAVGAAHLIDEDAERRLVDVRRPAARRRRRHVLLDVVVVVGGGPAPPAVRHRLLPLALRRAELPRPLQRLALLRLGRGAIRLPRRRPLAAGAGAVAQLVHARRAVDARRHRRVVHLVEARRARVGELGARHDARRRAALLLALKGPAVVARGIGHGAALRTLTARAPARAHLLAVGARRAVRLLRRAVPAAHHADVVVLKARVVAAVGLAAVDVEAGGWRFGGGGEDWRAEEEESARGRGEHRRGGRQLC